MDEHEERHLRHRICELEVELERQRELLATIRELVPFGVRVELTVRGEYKRMVLTGAGGPDMAAHFAMQVAEQIERGAHEEGQC